MVDLDDIIEEVPMDETVYLVELDEDGEYTRFVIGCDGMTDRLVGHLVDNFPDGHIKIFEIPLDDAAEAGVCGQSEQLRKDAIMRDMFGETIH
jgi:hypothetical protein